MYDVLAKDNQLPYVTDTNANIIMLKFQFAHHSGVNQMEPMYWSYISNNTVNLIEVKK